MNPGSRKRAAVLISGRGSNMIELVKAAIDPAYPAEIVMVISNRADAAGLDVAEASNIPTRIIAHGDFDDRAAHDMAIDEALEAVNADFVCLAGYMRLLSDEFVKKWQGRMINVHPALLPSFKGLDTHARALMAGCRIHGATVHFVTSDMDEGPIILQGAVPVVAGDTEDTLAERVLAVEHQLYPAALKMIAEGSVRMSGGGSVLCGPVKDADAAGVLISPSVG